MFRTFNHLSHQFNVSSADGKNKFQDLINQQMWKPVEMNEPCQECGNICIGTELFIQAAECTLVHFKALKRNTSNDLVRTGHVHPNKHVSCLTIPKGFEIFFLGLLSNLKCMDETFLDQRNHTRFEFQYLYEVESRAGYPEMLDPTGFWGFCIYILLLRSTLNVKKLLSIV